MKPSEEQLCFRVELATAIQQWSQVELSLANLVASCAQATTAKELFRRFYEEQSFHKKLAFADDSVSPRINSHDQLIKDWSKLQVALGKKNDLRNKLAHWMLIHYPEERQGRRVVLVHPILDRTSKASTATHASRGSKAPAGAIGLRELVEFRYAFFELGLALQNFRARGAGQPEPFTGPPLKVPVLAQIRASTMAYLGLQ